MGVYYVLVETDATGFVAEGSESNNTGTSSAIETQPSYRAMVETSIDVANAGTPIPLTGSAVDSFGSPVANQPVKIVVNVRGTTRKIEAITDESGFFQTEFHPLPGEAGNYTIGADHPGVNPITAQDTFSLVGMRAQPDTINLQVMPGSPTVGTIELTNQGDMDLTGLSASVLNAPSNLNVALSSPIDIVGMESGNLQYTISAADASIRQAEIVLRITSAEGALLDVPLNVNVIPLVAQLVANPGFLNRGMVRGEQTFVEFDVRNIGGAAVGELAIVLPDVPWMKLVSPETINLEAGRVATITLRLTPDADLPLGLYESSIAIEGLNTWVEVPFSLRSISEAVGDVFVNVQDEYTFFAEGQPQVADAEVILRDVLDNTAIVAQATTDSFGGSRWKV